MSFSYVFTQFNFGATLYNVIKDQIVTSEQGHNAGGNGISSYNLPNILLLPHISVRAAVLLGCWSTVCLLHMVPVVFRRLSVVVSL